MFSFINSFKRLILILVLLVVVTFSISYVFDQLFTQQMNLSELLRETGITVIIVAFSAVMILLIRRSKPFISKSVGFHTATFFQYLMVAIILVVMAFTILGVFHVEANTLLLGGSIVSIIAGLAVSTFVGNYLDGVLLLTSTPISTGDTVVVNGVTGRITSINATVTIITNAVGGTMIIPNVAIVQGGVIVTKYPSNEAATEYQLPYVVGDRILTTFMNQEGTAVEVTPFRTKILLDSGKELTFLNSGLLQGTVAVAKVTSKPQQP